PVPPGTGVGGGGEGGKKDAPCDMEVLDPTPVEFTLGANVDVNGDCGPAWGRDSKPEEGDFLRILCQTKVKCTTKACKGHCEADAKDRSFSTWAGYADKNDNPLKSIDDNGVAKKRCFTKWSGTCFCNCVKPK